MKAALIAVKNHVSAHRTQYAVGATAIAAGVGIVKVTREWTEFYDEHVKPEMDNES